jgi:PPOX class probable F420-dependent enzyme
LLSALLRWGTDMRLDAEEARRRFLTAPSVRLATVRPDGTPHLVPITFAACARDTLVFAVDHKPKSTQRLARLANIAAHPAVCLLADEWSADWPRLWWARADGRAVEIAADDPRRPTALAALSARYPQYREQPPAGPVVWIDVHTWTGWSGSNSVDLRA